MSGEKANTGKNFNKKKFIEDVKSTLRRRYRMDATEATQHQLYMAVSEVIEDAIIDQWMKSCQRFEEQKNKIVYYLSMEFLIGRALGNNLLNLGEYDGVKEALAELGLNINALEEEEPDPALGNGGLGRLAACFMDSLASLGYHAYGCGIRYHYGMFKQKIKNGFQKEVPDTWLEHVYPFELKRQEHAKEVRFGGNTRIEYDPATHENKFIYENYSSVLAVPYDIPVVGFNNGVVDALRIWDAEAINRFELASFDRGEYNKAVEQDNLARTITEVLYPNDNHYAGKELRLKQQYFFISASVQEALCKHMRMYGTLDNLPEKCAFQLNDTHPTVAIPELMRLLMDEYGYGWDKAWDLTTRTCAYTNHTIMAEALEKWPIDYLEEVVPHLLPIIRELDARIRSKVEDKTTYIIDDQNRVHMAHMDIHYGYSVNGVAALHTDILKNSELNNFYKLYPEKFNNKTNGITFRRWFIAANPEMSDYIESLIGPGFKKDAEELKKLLAFKDNEEVLKEIGRIRAHNKRKLCRFLYETQNLELDINSIFDVQVKRLHEYKRQQMNALYAIYKYFEIKAGHKPNRPITMIFGAKAAPAYTIAKDIIHLILCLQELTANDPEVSPYLRVVMIENYNVTKATKLIPAADISEQISLASKEASGTSNMKFMLNGAVTLGTEDGANVEIHELVGDENIYVFGKDADTVVDLYDKAAYHSKEYYDKSALIKKLVDFIVSDEIMALGNKENLERLHHELISKDWFMTLLDLEDYIETKEKMFADFDDRMGWYKKEIVNIANAGYFSSDRTIAQYNDEIWHLK